MKNFLRYFLVGMICLSAFACSDPLRGGGDDDDDPIPIPPPETERVPADTTHIEP